LKVWKKAVEFAVKVIRELDNMQSERKHFRIIEQTEAAVTSISANIAEGKGRYSKKEFRQFLYIARGSVYETVSFLNILLEMRWIPTDKTQELESEALSLNKMLNALINSIN